MIVEVSNGCVDKYLNAFRARDCTFSSVIAKITILAFPIILLVAYLIDLFTRSEEAPALPPFLKPTQTHPTKETPPIDANPTQLKPKTIVVPIEQPPVEEIVVDTEAQLEALDGLKENWKWDHEALARVDEVKEAITGVKKGKSVEELWKDLSQRYRKTLQIPVEAAAQAAHAKGDWRDRNRVRNEGGLNAAIMCFILDELFCPGLQENKIKVLDALSAMYYNEYAEIDSEHPDIWQKIQELKAVYSGKNKEKSIEELWNVIRTEHSSAQESYIANAAGKPDSWHDREQIRKDLGLRLAIQKFVLDDLFFPNRKQNQIEVINALANKFYCPDLQIQPTIVQLIDELRETIEGKRVGKSIAEQWEAIKEYYLPQRRGDVDAAAERAGRDCGWEDKIWVRKEGTETLASEEFLLDTLFIEL